MQSQTQELLKQDLPALFQVSQLPPAADRSLQDMVNWINAFLAKPHPQAGRPGPVCPFIPRSLKLDTVWLAAIPSRGLTQADIEVLVKRYRDTFLALEPAQGELATYKAIMLVFPDVDPGEAADLIDGVQRSLKPYFVEEGLMIGEFHAQNQTPGLHNPHFRPLRSPVPMLAIRFMVESDLPFLDRLADDPKLRLRYLQAYLNRMASSLNPKQLQTAQQAQAQAQFELTSAAPLASTQGARRCPFAWLTKFFAR